MADIRREPADQTPQAPSAQQASEPVELHGRRQFSRERRGGQAGDMHLVAQRRLLVGEIDAITLRAGDTGGKDRVEDAEVRSGRAVDGEAARQRG